MLSGQVLVDPAHSLVTCNLLYFCCFTYLCVMSLRCAAF